MKALFLKAIVIAGSGFLATGALSSCSEKAKQERAAEKAAETATDIMEENCKLLESIKDKESAGKAIEKMDSLADKYGKLAEQAKKAGSTPPDAAAEAKMNEKSKALVDRMTKATAAAMPIIQSDPALAKAYMDKQMLIAKKMTEAQAK